MKFNLKEYQRQKTKQYLKNNNFILFAINANQKSQNWIVTEQGLLKLKLNYYKVYNNTTKKTIESSINSNAINIINSTFFFLQPKNSKVSIKANIFNFLNSIFFTVLAIKLNKKIYSITQSKNIISYNHKKNVSLLYQFLIINLKYTYSTKKV
jgi:hypothetical protein